MGRNPDVPGLVKTFGGKLIFCGGVVDNLYERPLEEFRSIINRACGLPGNAERGFIFMGGAGIDLISRETWEQWHEIIHQAREQ